MKVLVNAVSIKEGGPRVVLRNLVQGMHQRAPNVRWIIAAPGAEDVGDPLGANCEVIEVDVGNPIDLIGWYQFRLPAAVNRLRPNVMFSLTNYLPDRKLSCPTVLLEQHAGHFSREFESLDRAFCRSLGARMSWRYKNAWVRRSVRTADMLIVQTRALADRIAETGLRSSDRIAVVPHGPGKVRHAAKRHDLRSGGAWRIGYVSKFGVQKNFETLFRAARRLSDAGHSLRLVLTLDPAYPPAAQMLDKARDLGVAHLIENRGEIGDGKTEEVYDSLDIMTFCSVCESFGFPMVEAMARGLPIVVADTPENREITGRAALSFSPYDHAALARQIERLILDETERSARAELSLSRGRDYSWSQACTDTLALLEKAGTAPA